MKPIMIIVMTTPIVAAVAGLAARIKTRYKL